MTRRWFRAFDWKLVVALTAFGCVICVGLSLVQQQQVIDQRGQAIKTAMDNLSHVQAAADRNAETLAAFQRTSTRQAERAEAQRSRLRRQVERLTDLLRSYGIDAPAFDSEGPIAVPPPTRAGGDSAPKPRKATPHHASPTRPPKPTPAAPSTPSTPEPSCAVSLLTLCVPLP